MGRTDTTYARPTLDAASSVKTFVDEIEMAGYPTSDGSEISARHGRAFHEDFEAQMQRMKKRHLEGLFVFKGSPDGGPVPIMP